MSGLGNIGKYELRRQIGRGAMGVVYEAFDTVIERRVALKMLRTEVFPAEQLPEVRARVKREAHSAGKLSHPNIVTIFDYGEHQGAPYIVMDLMEGEELSKSLESGARMQLGTVARVMEQLLAALGYAHEHGVVHRDVKPANMFVLRDGTLKVVDFGLARVESSNLTETGAVLGTPAYMSPEQFLGIPVDARSDIFSAGVVLYQLLTGDRPFTGSPTTIMQKVLRQDPIEPSALNPTLSHAWDTIIKRALAKKPDDRLQSARQFAEWVRLAHEGKALPQDAAIADSATTIRMLSQEATVRIPAPGSRRRKLTIAGAAAAAVVLVVAVAAAVLYRRTEAPVPPPPVAASVPGRPAPAQVHAATAPAEKPQPVQKKERPVVARAQPAPVIQPAPKVEPAPKMATVAPPAAPKTQAPPPLSGKVKSIDHNWGFLVAEVSQPGSLKTGDRLYAHLGDGRRVSMVVRRISGNLVSAVPEGQKLSDDMLGASVSAK
ncbi:MAG TPA: protein kinase [Burkholderiales bacterium]|nr:protein kinase [Burkholderiales bacterium]